MNIEDAKKKLDQSNINNLYNSAKGIMSSVSKAASGTMSGSVAEAIKNAGAQDMEEKLTRVKESSEQTKQLLQEAKAEQQAGADAAIQPEEQPEDGLQRMIQEAKLQTDLLGQGNAMIGAGPALQGAGQKLRQVTAGLPAANVEEQEQEWVDNSYLTPQSELKAQGQKMQGAWVDPKAGTYMQRKLPDGSFEQDPMMYMRDGTAASTEGKTEAEIREMIQKAQDDTFAITGRVYRPNADGSVPQWLSVGDQVVTAGGTYVITGHDREKGGYHSMLLDANQTTDNYGGNYNTGTYGSIIGERNEFNDSFRGNRDSNGEYTGYGGYSVNQQTGKMQFDTVAFTFDGTRTRAAVVDGVAYEVDAKGNLAPMEAGSLIQDASERYWIIGADGTPIDVTPANPKNNPLNDPTGEVGKIQEAEAEKAGLDLNRKANEGAETEAGSAYQTEIDALTQAQIDQTKLALQRQQSATESANRELYREYRKGQEQLEDQLVGAGVNASGVSEKLQAQLTAEWLEAMNRNLQQARTAEEDAAYQIQLAKLQALKEREAEAKAAAQQKAQVLAQYGDFSGYAEMGYTPAQIAQMEAVYASQNAANTTYQGLSNYAQTLLSLYHANPGYDIKRGLQQALDGGLISQQDYIAGLQTAAGMAV